MSQLEAAYEDTGATYIGRALEGIRRAAGLRPADITKTRVPRMGKEGLEAIASKGGIDKWEAGEPGVKILRYVIALARMNPSARHALIATIDGGEVRMPDPHVGRLTAVMEEVAASNSDWPTVAMALEALLKTKVPRGEERATSP